MALFVNTNVAALNGQKNLMNVTNRMNSSFEKLSSGSRINSAKDDAAGLQIANRLTTQIIGLKQGTRNANDGISIAQIAEGALAEVTNNFQRMRQLAVQGGNRTLSLDDREALSQEFTKLLDVNDDIAERTAFGTRPLLNYESPDDGFQIQSGAQSGEQDKVTTGNTKLTNLFSMIASDEGVASLQMSDMAASTIQNYGTTGKIVAAYIAVGEASSIPDALSGLFGVGAVTDFNSAGFLTDSAIQINHQELTKILEKEFLQGPTSTVNHLSAALSNNISAMLGIAAGTVDSSIGLTSDQQNSLHAYATDTILDAMSDLVTQVDKARAKMGAEQNGLASTIRSNTTAVVNVSDSRSRIEDTDFAEETAELTRNQIIQQASTSILAQANQLPQAALSLLGG